MKRKIGFVAAVILVGAFVVACNQKPTEPTATPAPSPTPAATEEPATSDLPSDAVIIEDTSLAQPVNQEVVDHGPSNEGATYESDAEFDQKLSAEAEKAMQGYMDRGHTREEAEAWWQDRVEAGHQAAAEEQERLEANRAEDQERIEKENAKAAAEADKWYLEHYGISRQQASGMSAEELCELAMQKGNQGG